MICQPCKDERPHNECWAVTKDRTWCDCQHLEKGNVILDPQFCKHLSYTKDGLPFCPSCGKVMREDDTPDRDSGDDGRVYDISPGAFIEGPYEGSLREISDTIGDTTRAEQQGQPADEKQKRSLIPGRNKKASSS